MKTITITVDEDVYYRVRLRAAELEKSVSEIVREKLIEFASEERVNEQLILLEKEALSRIRERGVKFSASERLNRVLVHDRDALH